MRDTSLVMNMLLKKQRKIRVAAIPRMVPTRESTLAAIYWRKFSSRSPSTNSIRQKSTMRVLKSIYPT